MTTVVAEKKPAAAPAQQPAKIISHGMEVMLDRIDVRDQVRKKFDEAAIKELAANMDSCGVINAVTLRPHPTKPGQYVLVSGERRLRAAKQLKWSTIRATVLELDDAAALEYQAAENIHRKDLTPIEEARGFKALLDARRYTVQQLAELVDKSEKYVYRAVALLELPAKAIDAIESGKITPAHGHQLLRAPKEMREKLLRSRWTTFDELEEIINDNVGRDLNRAPFPKEQPYAGKPACSTCPYNSGNQGQLFDGAPKGKCTNAPCFETKEKAFTAAEDERVRKQYPGMAYLGKSDSSYTLEGKHKVTRLEKLASNKKVAAAMKAEPEKFAFALVTDFRWEGNRNVRSEEIEFFAKDKALVLKLIGKSNGEAYRFGAKSSSSGGGYTRPSITPKQRFIRRAVWKAWMEAATKVDIAKSRPALLTILEKLEPGHYETKIPQEVMGIEEKKSGWSTKLVYDKLTLPQLLSAVLLFALDTHELRASDFKPLGVNTESLKKKAQEAAEKAWDARRGAK